MTDLCAWWDWCTRENGAAVLTEFLRRGVDGALLDSLEIRLCEIHREK